MYGKYIVYLDDGCSVYRVAVVAVKDVTADYPIDANRVAKALMDAGFSGNEKDFIVRLCTGFGVCE